jgi:hypothetical protein
VVPEKTMHSRIAVGIALLLAAATQAAEPKPAAAATSTPSTTSPTAPARAPLKLRIGDIRKYMMPNEFQAAVNAQDADKSTIIVEGQREAAPLKSTQPLATGLGAVFSLFASPVSAWRMFLPDPNGVAPGPPNPVPQRDPMAPLNGENPHFR